MMMFPKDQNGDADEKLMGDLLKTPDQRPPVPPDDISAIRDAARAVWQQRYADRSGVFRARWLLPVAAALLGGIVLIWWMVSNRVVEPILIVAQVERVNGAVTVSLDNNTTVKPVAVAQHVPVTSLIETRNRDSRLALRLHGGQSLRLDRDTRVRFVSTTIVELESGAVYLDSRGGRSTSEVTIRTADGDFRPIGTQFEVRRDQDRTLLRVREGQVSVMRPGGTVTASQGENLIVHHDGTIARSHVNPDDPSWDWVLQTVPAFDIDGRTLSAFLEWVAREKGWKLQYANQEAAAHANTIILSGSISHLTLDDALRTVTLGSEFDYKISDGTLVVSASTHN